MKNFFPEASNNYYLGTQGLFSLGLILIVLSIITMAAPLYTSLAITIILGVMMLAAGVGYAAHARANKKEFFFSIAIAIINIIAGTLVLLNPTIGLLTITLVFALMIIMQGIVKIGTAFQISWADGGVLLCISGIISILLGVFIWTGWPSTAAWVLGLFLSIDLFIAGCSMLFLSSTLKKRS